MAGIDAERERIIGEMAADPWRAHTFLFPHRHPEASSPAHREAVLMIHGQTARGVIKAFRGFGKSTLIEEAIVIQGAFRRFHNKLIVGASYERACERLAAIKREIDQNETLEMLFGRLRGPIWQEGKIELVGGICIQALGRDQSLRGTKHYDWRPDSALVDDVEDKDEVRSPLGRRKTQDWFLKEFLPALADPVLSTVEVLGTPMDPESLVVELEKAGWPTKNIPVKHLDDTGQWRATWEGKFPLWKIAAIEKDYARDMTGFQQEYMLQAVSDADRVFTREMFRIEPRPRSWQAVYAMYDPARTTNRQSATTGKAVWSWLQNRLIVWEASAEMWQPDEIIADVFRTADEFNPVWIGVEEDGLNEFIRQPLRHEQVRRGQTIPFRPIRAPRSKLDFIRGLQPFFGAREIIFVQSFSELEAQLLSFPTGRIDAPNALAYALLLRPGALIYDNFSDDHIEEELNPVPGRPLYLAANATGSVTTAILVQQVDGQLRILADWVREGMPSEAVADIHMEAALEGDTSRLVRVERRPRELGDALKNPEARMVMTRLPVRWVTPPRHNEVYTNVGLVQAIQAIPATVARGSLEALGRDHLRSALAHLHRGAPAFVVSSRASWTLRALSGGYCRALGKGGLVTDHAEEGVYRVLIEGLESFAGMMAMAVTDENEGDSAQPVSYDAQGRAYKSAMPARRR